jgi:hypothetical protein
VSEPVREAKMICKGRSSSQAWPSKDHSLIQQIFTDKQKIEKKWGICPISSAALTRGSRQTVIIRSAVYIVTNYSFRQWVFVFSHFVQSTFIPRLPLYRIADEILLNESKYCALRKWEKYRRNEICRPVDLTTILLRDIQFTHVQCSEVQLWKRCFLIFFFALNEANTCVRALS